ncbi:MAG: Hsp20/alpha crystallin family protein [Micromonosporaceae bacterium]
MFTDISDWFENDFPFAGMRMITFRVEDYIDDGNYVVRAELPGVDPEKDVTINVEHGTLEIRAERREETKEKRRSEFRYGSLHRTLRLPEGADEEQITARYDRGILEVTVPIPKTQVGARKSIPVEKSK